MVAFHTDDFDWILSSGRINIILSVAMFIHNFLIPMAKALVVSKAVDVAIQDFICIQDSTGRD